MTTTSGEFQDEAFNDFQREIGEWGAATFTQATWTSIHEHLKREVEELRIGCVMNEAVFFVGQTQQPLIEEFADVFMLMCHKAHREGFSLYGAISAKFERNKMRTWGQPDAQGVVEHVSEGE